MARVLSNVFAGLLAFPAADAAQALERAPRQLAAILGDDAGHQRELREAHRLCAEVGATGHAERVGRELADP